jgi:ferritin-like metal-binding protein YciE
LATANRKCHALLAFLISFNTDSVNIIASLSFIDTGSTLGNTLCDRPHSLVKRVINQKRTAMKLDSLKELYVDELKDLYSAENQLLKALPKMAKAATSAALKKGFEKHLEETKGQVKRLEQIFTALGESPKGKKCKAMEGLVEEGKELMEEDAEPEVMDAALIAAAQRVEHYEIAGYGCVRTYAGILGETKAEKLLQQTLDEEGKTDQALTKLAEKINIDAEDPDGEE